MKKFFLLQGDAPTPAEFDFGIVWRTIRDLGEGFLARVPYLVIALIIFGVFLIVARIVKGIIHTAGERTRLDVTLADLLGRLASAAIAVVGLFVAAVIIFPAFKPGDLVAGLGITSVAIGFAFKDVLQNFFAGILILWRRPFVVGDQIRTKDYEGTVEQINIRSTRLKTYDGERAVLPNGDVYTSAILVRTAYAQRRVKFTVGIGYTDSIEEARETIHRVLRETEGVMNDPGPWVYVSELAPSSVNFTVYFWTNSQQANVLQVSDRVATKIKLALDEAQIDLPYPHTVVLFHDTTGSRKGDIARDRYLTTRAHGDFKPRQSGGQALDDDVPTRNDSSIQDGEEAPVKPERL
ncbi:MAG: mechanosensitive ion channel family protein [Pyrinomonadaceae bacterium]